MAYSATVTITPVGHDEIVVSIVEIDASPTDYAEIPLPQAIAYAPGTMLRARCVLAAGTGTTVAPILRNVPSALTSDGSVEWQSADVAALTDAQPEVVVHGDSGIGTGDAGYLYHYANVDNGADNAILTTYYLRLGWGDR